MKALFLSGSEDALHDNGAVYRTVRFAHVEICRHGLPRHGQRTPYSCGHCPPIKGHPMERTPRKIQHDEAMGHAHVGFAAKARGEEQAAVAAFRLAWEMEREVASSLLGDGTEPMKSIIFRSAASLALLCGERADATRLASIGLAGEPPEDVREELEAILAESGKV